MNHETVIRPSDRVEGKVSDRASAPIIFNIVHTNTAG
jgi:hypothetical protein